MNIMLYAIPVFFLLIGVELIIQQLTKTNLYRFNDSVANISTGILDQLVGVFAKTVVVVLYYWVYEHWRLFEIPMVWWASLLVFIGVDFFYYWAHRYLHEVSLFWGTHIVHHQSEEYNLSVALRQSAFQKFVSMFFFLPLALLGFAPQLFLGIAIWVTLYQFWIHTKLIKKLPWPIEYVFNTPSHHRVHHGMNPKYIDKNHAGTFIIFDRMFGTFQEEEEEVVYGVTKPLHSWNAVWANFDYYKDLFGEMAKTPGVMNKIKMLYKKPGWSPATGLPRLKEVTVSEQVKYDERGPVLLNAYVLVQFVVVLLGATFMLGYLGKEGIGTGEVLLRNSLLALLIVSATASLGALMERHLWAFAGEVLRHVAIPLIVWWGFGAEAMNVVVGFGVLGGASVLWVVWLMRFRR